MAITQAHIDALNQAIADGVRQVTINGQTTTYNTTDSLIRARDDMKRELADQEAKAAGKVRTGRRYWFHAGRGFQ